METLGNPPDLRIDVGSKSREISLTVLAAVASKPSLVYDPAVVASKHCTLHKRTVIIQRNLRDGKKKKKEKSV